MLRGSSLTEFSEDGEIKSVENEIWCEVKSCTRSEFYQAYAAGLTPKYNLDIDSWDFDDASLLINGERKYPVRVKYNDVIYNIMRTYEKDKFNISLTVG